MLQWWQLRRHPCWQAGLYTSLWDQGVKQAINCFLAVSSCTLGSKLCPYLRVLVALKLQSSLQGQWLINTIPPLASGSGLDATLGLEICSSGWTRYSLGPNTLLRIQGCPCQWCMSGQVASFKIFIINWIFFLICSSSGLPYSPSRAWQYNTLLATHMVSL